MIYIVLTYGGCHELESAALYRRHRNREKYDTRSKKAFISQTSLTLFLQSLVKKFT